MLKNNFEYSGIVENIQPLEDDQQFMKSIQERKDKNQRPPMRMCRVNVMGLGSTIPFYLDKSKIKFKQGDLIELSGKISPNAKNSLGRPLPVKIEVIKQ